MIKYADDINIIVSQGEDECAKAITDEFYNVQSWACANLMIINRNKTKCINFNNQPKSPVVLPDFFNIDTHIKILGLIIDSKLSWSLHVNHTLKRQSSALHIIRVLKFLNLPNTTIYPVYLALVDSLAIFGCQVFVGISKQLSSRLDKISKRAHKIVCGRQCSDLKCTFRTLNSTRRLDLSVRLFKTIENNQESIAHSLVPDKLCYSQKYRSPTRKTAARNNSFFVWIPDYLNKL
jgi:hypothetical protein